MLSVLDYDSSAEEDERFVTATRARYERLLPKYGSLWRSMIQRNKNRKQREPLSFLPAIENRQAVSLRVATTCALDCPFGENCQGCATPSVESVTMTSVSPSSESSESTVDIPDIQYESEDEEEEQDEETFTHGPDSTQDGDAFGRTAHRESNVDSSQDMDGSEHQDRAKEACTFSSIYSRTQFPMTASDYRDVGTESDSTGDDESSDDDYESEADNITIPGCSSSFSSGDTEDSGNTIINRLHISDSDDSLCETQENHIGEEVAVEVVDIDSRSENEEESVVVSNESSSEEEWDDGDIDVVNKPNQTGDAVHGETRSREDVDGSQEDIWIVDSESESSSAHDESSAPINLPAPKAKRSVPVPERSKRAKSHFCKTRESIAKSMFEEFNRRAFDGALANVELTWSNKLRTTAGLSRLKRVGKARAASIELSTKVIDDNNRLRDTLMHEMCHAAAWLLDGVNKPAHGQCFKKWAVQAMRRVPQVTVTTRHDYEIQFRFAWACTAPKCGVVIQRHSRSIDVRRQCCGKCKSKLIEIEVPPSGSIDSKTNHVPRKQAALSTYALFVKQNSKRVREELMQERGRSGQPANVSQPDVLREIARLWRKRNQMDGST